MMVVSGFSGAGTDAYLRKIIEKHPNAWTLSPHLGVWDTSKIRHVVATADDLA
jgi:hypothetical protein